MNKYSNTTQQFGYAEDILFNANNSTKNLREKSNALRAFIYKSHRASLGKTALN
jgi:hypothetical protein